MPAGARLRRDGLVSESGLCTQGFEKDGLQGGAELLDEGTPPEAFRLEAEFQVGDFAATSKVEHISRIWDDMGIGNGTDCDNTGLEVGLRQTPDGYWTPYAVFGMGNGRFGVDGVKRRLYGGATTNLVLFFGANGRVVIEFGGLVAEKTFPASCGLAPSKRYRPVIGSGPGSHPGNFDGFIRRLSVTPMRREPAFFSTPGRMAFLRGETNAVLAMTIANRSGAELRDVRVTVEQFGESGCVGVTEFQTDMLADGAELPASVPMETRIRPGRHKLRAALRAHTADGSDLALSNTFVYAIGPQVGDRMRVAMWGMAVETPPELIRDFGFTHSYVYLGGPRAISPDFDPKPFLNTLDLHLAGGIRTLRALSPSLYPEDSDKGKYARWNRNGKPASKRKGDTIPEVSHPAIVERFRSICAFDAGFFAGHPAFQGVLPYSELREHAFPSFNTEHLRYKAETGRDVPESVTGSPWSTKFSNGLEANRGRFPDGVVPDDDENYLFWRWWLKDGDGWSLLQSAGVDEFRKRIPNEDFLSFWDPAVRCAPAWGSGGSVDMLNQWCYAVPEPMNVAGPAEEVLAMTDGRPGQKAAIMTQLICYRSTVAPTDAAVTNPPEWAAKFPKASFPVIPPDLLQEATWSMIAKPVDAIMYHGWNTISVNHNKTGYCNTNPESAERLREILNGLVAPLGPVLRRLKREMPPVAVLESLTSVMMGGPATRGWQAPAVTCAQRARLDPRVVYEETLERDGLDGVKVLYAPQCMFLPASLVEKIRTFQKAGGILVADADCLSALKPDIIVPVMTFNPPESDHTQEVEENERAKSATERSREGTIRAKRVQQEAAEELRRRLAERGYSPSSDSSSPEIAVFNRRWKGTPYLFAINDKRTFGPYVGAWGLVMDKGQPFAGWVSIDDAENRIGAVYELSRGVEAAFTHEDGKAKVPVDFKTNDGRIFVFLPRKIGAVDLQVKCRKTEKPLNGQTGKPTNAHGGEAIVATMTVRDADGAPVPALLPVEMRLYDAEGREIDGGGWFCAEDGVAYATFTTNIDDPAGAYRIVCRDRASGFAAEKTIGGGDKE